MKKTYIIPTITTYQARAHKMMALSFTSGYATSGDTAEGNENNLDDQESTPWYK